MSHKSRKAGKLHVSTGEWVDSVVHVHTVGQEPSADAARKGVGSHRKRHLIKLTAAVGEAARVTGSEKGDRGASGWQVLRSLARWVVGPVYTASWI